ncbi:uncharacterized protein HaLaN_09637 [Haematococcus lacustris]|uniref:CBS domain-containing protein n=2 Tax=Haematococcus lacustris TaxID=44745 RepID=A0A699ZDW1_HAELA|nr:uncharacterized protein HaLaN_09637 [Haematococcus lacustris]
MVLNTISRLLTGRSQNEDARRALLSNKVSDLKRGKPKLAVLRDTATVEQALKVLADNKIVSAPVLVCDDPTPRCPTMGEGEAADILGFIDIRNVLESFLAEVNISKLNEVKLLQRMRVLEEKGLAFGAKRIKDLPHLGTDGDFIHDSQARSSLLELVLNGLLQPRSTSVDVSKNVVHRVALFDNEGKITQIISQSDIVKFLCAQRVKLGSLGALSLEELGMLSHKVEGVHPETSAIEALAIMSEKRLSSLAVLDPNGVILGNFSVSDMRTIVSEHFGALALPVGEFLAQEKRTEFIGFNRIHEEGVEGTAGHRFVQNRMARQRPRTPGEEVGQKLVLAKATTTLSEVMDLLVRYGIHRVYVVNEEEKPIGIVTHTDILRKLLQLAA